MPHRTHIFVHANYAQLEATTAKKATVDTTLAGHRFGDANGKGEEPPSRSSGSGQRVLDDCPPSKSETPTKSVGMCMNFCAESFKEGTDACARTDDVNSIARTEPLLGTPILASPAHVPAGRRSRAVLADSRIWASGMDTPVKGRAAERVSTSLSAWSVRRDEDAIQTMAAGK